ncbi:hypothetical protein D3C85_1707910 [compost metagenome]
MSVPLPILDIQFRKERDHNVDITLVGEPQKRSLNYLSERFLFLQLPNHVAHH